MGRSGRRFKSCCADQILLKCKSGIDGSYAALKKQKTGFDSWGLHHFFAGVVKSVDTSVLETDGFVHGSSSLSTRTNMADKHKSNVPLLHGGKGGAVPSLATNF